MVPKKLTELQESLFIRGLERLCDVFREFEDLHGRMNEMSVRDFHKEYSRVIENLTKISEFCYLAVDMYDIQMPKNDRELAQILVDNPEICKEVCPLREICSFSESNNLIWNVFRAHRKYELDSETIADLHSFYMSVLSVFEDLGGDVNALAKRCD